MNKTRLLSLLYLLSLLLLSVSGSLSVFLSETVYILSFILPTAIGVHLVMKEGREDEKSLLSLNKHSLLLVAPTVFPIILIIILTSSLTSFLIGLIFGAENAINLGDNLLLALVLHALLPSLLEEMLFRYLPMRIYKEENATMIVVSSLFFALVHRDFFVIPYAFIAGALFMIIDIIADSVWPSVILHALNNALSVLWIFYLQSVEFVFAFYALLIILSAVSVIIIIKRREEYRAKIRQIFKGERVKPDIAILYFAVPTLILAVLNLMAKI